MKHFSDNRRVLNELQKYSSSGKIDAGILSQVAEVNLKELMWALKEKKFNDVRKWVADNVDNDPQKIFRKIYDVASSICPTIFNSAINTHTGRLSIQICICGL